MKRLTTVLSLFLAAPAFAQQQASPAAPPAATEAATEAAPPDQTTTISVRSNLVIIPALVRTKSGDLVYTHTLDMRFVGQAFEVGVEVPAHRLDSLDAATLGELFADAHHRTFMHGAKTDRPIEIVTLRVGATLPIGTLPKLDRQKLAARAPENDHS